MATNQSAAAMTPAEQIAAALAQETAAQKARAAAELPLLQQAQDVLMGPEVQALKDALAPIAAALGPSNSASMLRLVLQAIDGARTAIPADVATHQRTQAQ